jgi:TrmH family RNA methyltransferase
VTDRPAGRDLRERLSNPRADRVKQVAALAGRSASGGGSVSGGEASRGKSARDRAGLFVVEGPQGVRELVAHRPADVRDVYVTDAAAASWPEIVAGALAAGLFVHPVTDDVAAAMSGDAQGVLAVARQWDVSSLAGTLAIPARARLIAILADVRDPGNAGTVIRAADAAGADLVVLAGQSVDVFNPKVVRATAGSLFHLPVVRGVPLTDAVAAARAAGLAVLAADGSGTLELTPGLAELSAPTAWLFGNEAHGLSATDLELADATVGIPIYGAAESLNLAAAAAVCLYASAFAQRA